MHRLFAIAFVSVILLPQSLWSAAAPKKSVMNMGTKVAAATNNTLVDAECQESYFGCMDAFCIVENVSGGRCQCSNKHSSLSARLKQIADMDDQSYAIATYGVEHIELGKAADDVLATSEKAFDKAMKDANDESLTDTTQKQPEDKKKTNMSFAEWNSKFAYAEEEDVESVYEVDDDDVANKKGDELYKVASRMCLEQTPQKCKEKKSTDMLKMLYAQKIRSDCAAFENSLDKQESEAYVKLENAKKNVREAALGELQNSNKYTLGECALEFKKCMNGADVCGEDWTNCVSLTASINALSNQAGGATKQVVVKGALSSTKIAATTMDALLAKKPLCEHVTNQCVKEKENVWDVFVKGIVSTIKSTELEAESKVRTSCLSSISECYVKACKDNMDPKDPEGSYDMCLSRPDNYKSFCKVELEPCLAMTGGNYDDPESSSLWQGILAKLSSMRVDSCTKEFKTCIQDNDRCGKDYSKCIGLDNDDVASICPEDKLTACYKEYNGEVENVRTALARIAQGIMLNVDNELLVACENAVVDSIVKVCGEEENCDGLVENTAGSHSLKLAWCEFDGKKYFNCKEDQSAITDIELGKTTMDGALNIELHKRLYFKGKFDGQIYWDYLDIAKDAYGLIGASEYEENIKDFAADMDDEAKKRVKEEIELLNSTIKNTIDTVEADPRVQYCITGRKVEGITNNAGFTKFIGKDDNARFPNLTNRYRRIIALSILHKIRENYFKRYDDLSDKYFVGMNKLSDRLADIEKINSKRARTGAARDACIKMGEGEKFTKSNSSPSAMRKVNRRSGNDGNLVGYSAESTYTYKRQVTTTFEVENLICHKCVRTQKCKKIGAGLDHCQKWDDEKEECENIQF